MPKLSIIVPVYKTEPFLRQCINSILNQYYTDYEIVLVDDGSPDCCPQICDEYANAYDRIRVIHKENGGLVSARKAGVYAATGSYIGYVDSDDWIEPDFFETMMSICESADADIVMSGFVLENSQGCEYITNYFESGSYTGVILQELISEGLYKDRNCINGVIASVWSKIFKKELLEKYQMLVDTRIVEGEDVAVVYPAMCAANKIVIDNRNVGYHYRMNDKSIINTWSPNYYERICILHEYLNDIFSKQTRYEMFEQSDAFFFYMLDKAIDMACYSVKWNPLNIRKSFRTVFDNSILFDHSYIAFFSREHMRDFRKSCMYRSLQQGRYIKTYSIWVLRKTILKLSL